MPDYPASYSPVLDAYDELCQEARALTDCPLCDGERIEPDTDHWEIGAPTWKTCARCHGTGVVPREDA